MQQPHKQFVSGVLIGSAMITMLGCTFLLNSSGGLNATQNNDGMGIFACICVSLSLTREARDISTFKLLLNTYLFKIAYD